MKLVRVKVSEREGSGRVRVGSAREAGGWGGDSVTYRWKMMFLIFGGPGENRSLTDGGLTC